MTKPHRTDVWQAGILTPSITKTHTPRGGVPGHASVLPQDSPAQVEQDIVEALLLSAFGGQLQDLRVAVKQLAGVAGRRRRLHLVAGQHPHLHTCLVERLDGVRRFFLEPVVMEKADNEKRTDIFSGLQTFLRSWREYSSNSKAIQYNNAWIIYTLAMPS